MGRRRTGHPKASEQMKDKSQQQQHARLVARSPFACLSALPRGKRRETEIEETGAVILTDTQTKTRSTKRAFQLATHKTAEKKGARVLINTICLAPEGDEQNAAHVDKRETALLISGAFIKASLGAT